MDRTYTTTALVLRTRPLGEKDRIVSLFSPDHGKIPCVAKGARRPGAKLAGSTQQFTCGRYALARGRNFDIITQVEVEETHHSLHKNVLASACAAVACELVERAVSERHPDESLYGLLRQSLTLLAAGENCEVLLRAYELRAATVLGYQPELRACVQCGRSSELGPPRDGSAAEPYRTRPSFSFQSGGLLCEPCRIQDPSAIRITAGTIETLKQLLNAAPEQLLRLRIVDSLRGELVRVIDGWIEQRLEVRLKSKEFLRQVVRTTTTPTTPTTETQRH